MGEVIEVGLKMTGAKKAADEIGKMTDETKDFGDSVELASDGLDKMTGGAISAFKGVVGGVKKAVIGMKTLKGALISTGIGALVVAVGSLVAYFTQTERGAKQLERVTAGLGIVMAKLGDTLAIVGEFLVTLFTEPAKALTDFQDAVDPLRDKIVAIFNDPKQAIIDFSTMLKQYVMDRIKNLLDGISFLGSAIAKLFKRDFAGALADAKQGVVNLAMANPLIHAQVVVVETLVDATKNLREEIEKAVSAQDALTLRSQKLREDQRKLSLAFAEGRAQIKENNLLAEDTTKSLDKRLEAAQKAIDIEKGLMSERQRLAKEERDIFKAQMEMSESTEADKERLVELEVALIDIRTESAEMQTTLNNKLNTMQAQADAEEEARLQELKDRQDMMDAEKKAAMDEMTAKIEENANKRIALAEAEAKAIKAARKQVVAAGFDALKSMAKTEEGAKRLAIAQILVNQGIAMSEAIRSAQQSASATGPGAVFTAPGFTASMIALVLGSFAQIKGIMNQAGAASESVGGGGGNVSAPAMTGGLIPDLDEINQGVLTEPVQAYVVQTQLEDVAAQTQAIQQRASL
jgi:hypothetical protein